MLLACAWYRYMLHDQQPHSQALFQLFSVALMHIWKRLQSLGTIEATTSTCTTQHFNNL